MSHWVGMGAPREGKAMGWRTQTNIFQVRKESSLGAAPQGQKQGRVSASEPPHHLPAPAPWSVRTPRHWDPSQAGPSPVPRLPDPQMLGLTQLSNKREQLRKLCSIPPWKSCRVKMATESFSNRRNAAELTAE